MWMILFKEQQSLRILKIFLQLFKTGQGQTSLKIPKVNIRRVKMQKHKTQMKVFSKHWISTNKLFLSDKVYQMIRNL